jgi:hypothetical protein
MHSKPCIWRLRSNGLRSRLTRQTRNEQSSNSQMSSRRFPPPRSVWEPDACFIDKPPRFGASNGRMEYVVAAIG